MSMRLRHLLAGVALMGFVGTMACQQRQEVEDNNGVDTLSTTDTTMMAPAPAPPSTTSDSGMGMGADTSMGHDTSGM